MNEEQMLAIKKQAHELGVILSNVAQDILRAAESIGEVFIVFQNAIRPIVSDLFESTDFEKIKKKLLRRDRYLRKYRARGERMKKK